MIKEKITVLDIETSDILVRTWNLFPNYINHTNIVRDKVILTACWKTLNEEETFYTDALMLDHNGNPDDKQVVADILEGIKDSDILLMHNGDKFDLPNIRSRVAIHGYDPLPPIRTIDTLKIARRLFKFTSNRLDYLGEVLGVGRKIPTDYELWNRVQEGNKKALAEMIDYCTQDVLLLEDVYNKLSPHITDRVVGHTINSTEDTCPKCQETKGYQKRGWGYNLKTKYQRYQCRNCHGWLRSVNVSK